MNADGSGQMNLSNNAAYDQYPVFSPDGSKIISCQTVMAMVRFTS
jgi:Tol biopolymer transport system component